MKASRHNEVYFLPPAPVPVQRWRWAGDGVKMGKGPGGLKDRAALPPYMEN